MLQVKVSSKQSGVFVKIFNNISKTEFRKYQFVLANKKLQKNQIKRNINMSYSLIINWFRFFFYSLLL